MSHNLVNMTGMVIGRLTVKERAESARYANGTRARWRCVCECGNTVCVVGSDLRSGKTQSCGCLHKEGLVARSSTHGSSNTRTYQIWCNMIQRTSNPKADHYKSYGARGIAVCDRWKSFDAFFSDMGHAPEAHSLERIDVNREYSPQNCTWIPARMQARNKTHTVWLTHEGERRPLVEWADIVGVKATTLRRRLKRGWDIPRTLTTPLRTHT